MLKEKRDAGKSDTLASLHSPLSAWNFRSSYLENAKSYQKVVNYKNKDLFLLITNIEPYLVPTFPNINADTAKTETIIHMIADATGWIIRRLPAFSAKKYPTIIPIIYGAIWFHGFDNMISTNLSSNLNSTVAENKLNHLNTYIWSPVNAECNILFLRKK